MRDKYVEGRDDLVEDWALSLESEEDSYSAGDYQYSS